MLVTCKWFGPLEAFHQIKLRIELNGDLIKWQAWEPKMQPWQVLHLVCVRRWGVWAVMLGRLQSGVASESSRVNTCVGTRPAMEAAVRRRRAQVMASLAGAGHRPCLWLSQTCPQHGLPMLSPQAAAAASFCVWVALCRSSESRTDNSGWVKCRWGAYSGKNVPCVARCGARQMKRIIRLFKIPLKLLILEMLKLFPRSSRL